MTRKRYTYCFIAVLIAAVLLTALGGYLSIRPDDYVGSYSKELLRGTEKLIPARTEEYVKALADMQSERDSLEQYRTVLRAVNSGMRGRYTDEEIDEVLSRYSYSESEAAERADMLRYCIDRLDYALSYPEYISGISKGVSDLSSVSIFGGDLRKNIIQTETDFYGFDKIKVSAEQDEGVKLLFSGAAADLIAVSASILCAVFYCMRCRSGASGAAPKRNRFVIFAALFTLGMLLIFTAEAVLSDRSLSLGTLSRPIQSVSDFLSCPYMMSVGALMLIRAIFRAAVCLIVYLLFVGAFSCRRRKTAVVIVSAFLALDALLLFSGARICLLAAMRPENILARYDNIFILGEAFEPYVLLTVYIALLLAGAFVFAGRKVSGLFLLAKEQSEREYFDEINARYAEARLIRHDISNHLAAVAMLMDEGDYEGARRYLGDVSAQLDEIKPPVKTGSNVLDALLFRKVSAAKDKGIPVKLDFSAGFRSSGMTDYDLCGMFSNLLDNAAEACEKLPRDERGITLSVKRQLDMLCIFCENKYAEIKPEGGGFTTTKQDKSVHGFGLKRIERIAAKYGGTVDISAENGIFAISVIINIKNKNNEKLKGKG